MIFVIIIVFVLASWMASRRLKKKFKKYSQIPLSKDLSGKEVAELMLRDNNIDNVQITCIEGKLTDHYDPTSRTVNLSKEVYHGRTAASTAVAAHECGHVLQHAHAYRYLELRTAIVPIQNISAKIINIIFMMMLFGAFALPQLVSPSIAILIIIACYSIFTLFAFITLPVEYDASKRALVWISERNIVNKQEYSMAKDALNAAASTYLIAALGSLATLMYYVMLFLGGGDD